MNYAVSNLGTNVEELNTILRVGVNDVLLKIINCSNGVVTGYHNKVCGVEVDRNAGRAE